MLLAKVIGEHHDAVGLAAKSADRCGIVEGIACDGELEDTPVADTTPLLCSAKDNGTQGETVKAIDEDPDADDGDKPIAGVTKVLPQLDKADIEGEEHHHHGYDTAEEKEIIEALLGHRLFK